MSVAKNNQVPVEALEALEALRDAVNEAITAKRKLGQYWVEWDDECKVPVKVWPDGRREPA